MKITILILKIILPSFLCALVITMSKMTIEYYPLSFGFILGLINWGEYKINSFFGMLLTLFFSYLSFFLGFACIPITIHFLRYLSIAGEIIGAIISIYFIAPLFLFIFYNFLFKLIYLKFYYLIITLSLFLLIIQAYVTYNFGDSGSPNISDNRILQPYTLWQIIMALALQLILYQKELKGLFGAKK